MQKMKGVSELMDGTNIDHDKVVFDIENKIIIFYSDDNEVAKEKIKNIKNIFGVSINGKLDSLKEIFKF